MARAVSQNALQPRDPRMKPTDIAAVRQIAQAAVEVELFTIPLYMTSLYSIYGNHEINSAGNSLYKGWIWPGPGPTAEPSGRYAENQRAFNIIYSIFVEEMLHLQLAANMASAIGQSPKFTGPPLQTLNNGWTCYGPHLTVIPHIIDLMDTVNSHVRVNIGPLDAERVELFRIIEQPDEQARKSLLLGGHHKKYFPKAPFDDWQIGQPLPLFGTIGHMYQCYYDYLHVRYTDGTTLWDAVLEQNPVQQDYFNRFAGPSGLGPQYDFDLKLDTSDGVAAFDHMCKMMDAITDQGEGSVLDPLPDPRMLTAVEAEFQALKPNLEKIYPSYDSNGKLLPESAQANARCQTDANDHYERFEMIERMLPHIVTCDKAGKAGNWTAQDFVAPPARGDAAPAPGEAVPNPYNLPTQQDLADAWNAVKKDEATYYPILCTAVVGAIAGMTNVLDDYWSSASVAFPSPAMGGTGDRMATIWAALGKAPDLSIGVEKLPAGTLGHSCQGIDYNTSGQNDCADPNTYHSCIGSNNCHAEGGCGFVNDGTGHSCGGNSCAGAQAAATQPTQPSSTRASAGSSGGICGAPQPPGEATPATQPLAGTCGAPPQPPAPGPLCGGPKPPPPPPGPLCGGPKPPSPSCSSAKVYSSPGDNKCKGFGGCAVPISASQLYPKPTPDDPNSEWNMSVYDFDQVTAPDGTKSWTSVPLGTIPYKMGDKVEDIAYQAFSKVMQNRKVDPPKQPPPNVLRLIFPPST